MQQTITTVQGAQFLGFGKNITSFVIEQSIITAKSLSGKYL
jgi:hypothetical protein